MNVWVKRALIAVPIAVVLFFVAIMLYVNVIRDDAPDELGTSDLAAAVDGTGVPAETDALPTTTSATVVGDAGGPAAPTTSAAGAASTTTTAVAAAAFDGTWTVTDESEFGYRVEEVLFGVNATAAGRSNQITGDMTIAGTTVESAAFAVDVASIVSDDDRRDNQFRGNIMQTDQFPQATFTLTAPIVLDAIPADGAQVTASATGDLTLHGVTKPVTFDVTAQAAPGRIGVLGSIPILFADYGIDNPSRSGITTEDHGLLEFVLVFVPA
jgi:polyisoprenoid-binding protein YceI